MSNPSWKRLRQDENRGHGFCCKFLKAFGTVVKIQKWKERGQSWKKIITMQEELLGDC